MNDYVPTDEQIEALARGNTPVEQWEKNPQELRDILINWTRGDAALPAFQAIIRAAQAEALRRAVEAHTVIVTGKINPRDLLDEADRHVPEWATGLSLRVCDLASVRGCSRLARSAARQRPARPWPKLAASTRASTASGSSS